MIVAFLYTLILIICAWIGIFSAKQNIILMLVEIEIILLASNFNFIITSSWLDDVTGFIWSLVILVLAGVEASLGLSILIVYYRLRGVVVASYIVSLKG